MNLEGRLHDRCACGSVLSAYRSLREARVPAAAPGPEARPFVLAGTERSYERARPFVVAHIAVDWTLDPAARRLRGTAELDLLRADPEATEIELDAVGFDLEEVSLTVRATARRPSKKRERWRRARHVYDGTRLSVSLDASVRAATLRVRYSAEPQRGMYFLAPDAEVPTRPRQVWTQCQDEDARHLFPCHDAPHVKQTFDIQVAVEPGWFVLSNGDLVSSKAAQKKGHFHYQMTQPVPSYLFTVAAGEFAHLSGGQVDGVPLSYYVPVGREIDGKRTFANTPEMVRLFARLTGVPYPWSKYAQVVVHDFIFGGMENTGATTLYEHTLLDQRAALDVTSDDLISHELAHQWFGDLVTCRDWSEGWLNEGFATFMEHVWREHHLGRDEYEHGLRADLAAYLGEAEGRYERPVVCQDFEAPIDIFDRHLYEKGGLVLHGLRRLLGDELFWGGVHRYLVRHAGGVVETRDLQRALEETSGRSLARYFDEQIHRGGHVRLDVAVDYAGGALVVSVKQQLPPGAAPFALELELDIGHSEGRGGRPERVRRSIDQAAHTFALPMPRPRYCVVDPELRILGRVHLKVPVDLLRQQLALAPTGRGQLLAAHALGRHDDPATIRALGEHLRSRAFWGARAEAATALGNIRSPAAYELLEAASRTRHPKVRRAVATALGRFRTPEAAVLLKRLARTDESILVAAAACRALGQTRQPQAFEELVSLLDRPSWAETLRSGAIDGLAKLRDHRAVEPLRLQTRYGIPARARRTAIAALPEITSDRRTRQHLEELLDERDPHVRTSVVEALTEMGDPRAGAALQTALDREKDARVRRRIREALRDLGARGKKELRRLRDEVQTLRREHGELRARLSKVEDKLGEARHAKKGAARAPARRRAARG
ncbi:MAG: HEAT repeat domain-containing protein [Polyangiaceae bacterium]|nr:HEAT repeat domain-containing protein [Polyangiaceae bacterium]